MKRKTKHYKRKKDGSMSHRGHDDFMLKSGKLLIGAVVVTSIAKNLNKVV